MEELRRIASQLNTVGNDISNIQMDIRRNYQSISASMDSMSTELEEARGDIDRGFDRTNNFLRQPIEPSIIRNRTVLLELITTSIAEITGGIVELNGLLVKLAAFSSTTRVAVLAELTAIGTDVLGIDWVIGRILYNVTRYGSDILTDTRSLKRDLANKTESLGRDVQNLKSFIDKKLQTLRVAS